MTLDDGKTLVSVPYSYDINDKTSLRAQKRLGIRFSGDDLQAIRRALRGRAQSNRTRHAIALHPY